MKASNLVENQNNDYYFNNRNKYIHYREIIEINPENRISEHYIKTESILNEVFNDLIFDINQIKNQLSKQLKPYFNNNLYEISIDKNNINNKEYMVNVYKYESEDEFLYRTERDNLFNNLKTEFNKIEEKLLNLEKDIKQFKQQIK